MPRAGNPGMQGGRSACSGDRSRDRGAGSTSSGGPRSWAVTVPLGAPGSVAVVTGATGLTAAEAAQRVRAGHVNTADERTSRTFAEILRANVLTRFNAIIGAMFVLILIFGEGQDSLFGFVLLFNTLIGVVQEWRAESTPPPPPPPSAPPAPPPRAGAGAAGA